MIAPDKRHLPVVRGSGKSAPPVSVRVSLTDRCDLACVYCRPSRSDGYFERRLDESAWRAMLLGLVRAGVRRVRITGGEPLLHPRLLDVVRFLRSLGLDDLALTTNATRLERLAAPLREAGLRRLNVSLDTLDPARFATITRGGDLARVLRGLAAAVAAGFDEIKTNAVVLRGLNDHELGALATWAWERGIVPRFIEVMCVGEGARIADDRLVTVAEMHAILADLLADEPGAAEHHRGPARYVRARRDPRLRAGFISGSSHTFCETCDRLRVSADGTLRPCLATNDGLAASAPAVAGDVDGVARAVAEAWSHKPDGETWKGCTEPTAASVSMRATGG